MNVTVENLAPCRKLVRVEVDAATVDRTLDTVTAEFQREVRLPGFRPGKAPRDMVVKTYTKQIEEKARRKLLNEHYRKAMEEQKLRVLGHPEIEEIQFNPGQPFQFAATVETAPDFELPEYRGLPVKRESAVVTDSDMQRALDVLREQQVKYSDVTRPAQEGDVVVANYKGASEGKPLTDFAPAARGLTEQNNFWLHIKKDSFIPGFTEQLIGAQAGDHRTVAVDFPSDFVTPELVGKKGVYEVDVVLIKERALPDVNDEFAKSLGADNVDKLREGVRRDLQNELNYKQRRSVRHQIVRALLDRVQFDLPESMVTNETRNVVYDIVRENQERGVPKEAIDKQKEEIYAYANTNAKDRVKIAFVLGRVAEKEGIRVEEREITERVLFLAHQQQMKPEKMLKQLQERNGIATIHEDILSTKVLEFLELNAKAEDVPSGAASAPAE